MFTVFDNKKISIKTKNKIFNNLPKINSNKNKIVKILKQCSTPLFIVDTKILDNRYKELFRLCRKYWGKNKIAYSFKTNYEVAKLNFFKNSGLWAEVVSGDEYKMAKKLGFKDKDIIFNGPNKNLENLNSALINGSLVMIDNFTELARVITIAEKNKIKLEIGIRLNTEIYHGYVSRFGFLIDTDEALKAINLIHQNKYLKLVALHMHIGSDVASVKSYKKAAGSIANFISQNMSIFEHIKYIDMGGGFPGHGLAPYNYKGWAPQKIDEYIKTLSKPFSNLFVNNKPVLILEPGRYLVDDAIIFLTRVIDVRYGSNIQKITLDSTLTMLPLVEYREQLVRVYDKKLNLKRGILINSNAYGASCRENDRMYEGLLPKVEVGDLFIYFVVGAYNQSMSSEFIYEKAKTATLG